MVSLPFQLLCQQPAVLALAPVNLMVSQLLESLCQKPIILALARSPVDSLILLMAQFMMYFLALTSPDYFPAQVATLHHLSCL